jgi:surface antigen
VLAFTGIAAQATTATSSARTQAPPTEEEIRLKAESDARFEALQAQARARAAERSAAEERYRQGVADAAVARARYEADNARYQAELARSREAQADYERRRREYEAEIAGRTRRGAPVTRDAAPSSASGAQTASNGRTCEQQRQRNRRRGRNAGAVVGGIAGGLAGGALGGGTVGRLATIVTLAPVGALIGEAIASRLDCREQLQAAAATEEALRRGVGTTTTWTSETRPNVTGSSTVIAAAPASASNSQCLTVTDIIIVDGEETRAPKTMCRRPPSNAYVRV